LDFGGGMGWIVISSAVLRGGSWDSTGDAGPFCARLDYAPSSVYNSVGFRCCSS